jgi:hypothetical protein
MDYYGGGYGGGYGGYGGYDSYGMGGMGVGGMPPQYGSGNNTLMLVLSSCCVVVIAAVALWYFKFRKSDDPTAAPSVYTLADVAGSPTTKPKPKTSTSKVLEIAFTNPSNPSLHPSVDGVLKSSKPGKYYLAPCSNAQGSSSSVTLNGKYLTVNKSTGAVSFASTRKSTSCWRVGYSCSPGYITLKNLSTNKYLQVDRGGLVARASKAAGDAFCFKLGNTGSTTKAQKATNTSASNRKISLINAGFPGSTLSYNGDTLSTSSSLFVGGARCTVLTAPGGGVILQDQLGRTLNEVGDGVQWGSRTQSTQWTLGKGCTSTGYVTLISKTTGRVLRASTDGRVVMSALTSMPGRESCWKNSV